MVKKSQSRIKSATPVAASSQPVPQADANEPHIVRYTREEAKTLGPGKTNWDHIRNVSDEEIAAAVASDPDAVPLDIDWSDAEVLVPRPKTPLSIRLDEDVLEFFKGSGPRYQTRINEVLRTYMKHQLGKKGA